MSIYAEMECRFLLGSIQVLYSLNHNSTCRLEARQALIYQLVSGLTGENGKYNYSKAVHLYPPFFDISCSAKNYKIAPALTLKTDWTLYAHIPRFLLARPNRKQELCNQGFHFGRGNKAEQELSCNVSGESGVNVVEVFAFVLGKNGMKSKQGSKVIECHSGKDLLLNE